MYVRYSIHRSILNLLLIVPKAGTTYPSRGAVDPILNSACFFEVLGGTTVAATVPGQVVIGGNVGLVSGTRPAADTGNAAPLSGLYLVLDTSAQYAGQFGVFILAQFDQPGADI